MIGDRAAGAGALHRRIAGAGPVAWGEGHRTDTQRRPPRPEDSRIAGIHPFCGTKPRGGGTGWRLGILPAWPQGSRARKWAVAPWTRWREAGWFGRSMPGVYTPGWLMAPFGLLVAMRACGCCGSFGLGFEWAGSLGPGMSLFVRPFEDSGGACGFVRWRWRWKGGCGCCLLLSDCKDWG